MTTSEGYVTTGDGLRLFYRKAGEGPLTLVLNGVPVVDDFAPLADCRSIVFFDNRNRGRSDAVRDPSQIERGIHHDVDDLDAIRRHFGAARVDVIGHSYAGVTAALHAMKYPAQTNRVVQIGPMAPGEPRQYPPSLSYIDDTFRVAMAGLAELMKDPDASVSVEQCRRFWSVLGPIYVTNPADAAKLKWARCDLENERNFMPAWLHHLQPSIHALRLTAASLAHVSTPVLVIHGRKDRSAPYGGGRDWANLLPNARLLTIEDGGHVPWIEAPDEVFGAMRTFLDGAWPAGAERLASAEIS
jgi:pimeloyl-ACP methyl ester carboxylesterase